MRKLQLFSLVGLLAIVLTTAPAGAFTFKQGDNLGKLADWGSFYSPNATTPGATPNAVGDFAVGDWDQTLFSITDLYTPPTPLVGNKYYSGIPELVGLLYDLTIPTGGITVLRAPGTISASDPGKYEINLVSAARYALSTDSVASIYPDGRVDLWVDEALDFTPVGTGGYPADWAYGAPGAAGWDTNPFDAGEYDTFPTATGGSATILLSATLVAPDPINKPGVLLTLTLDFNDGTGATNQGFMHIVYNPTGIPFAPRFLGGLAEISFFNNFKFYPNATIPYEPLFDDPTTTPIFWATESEDPVTFTVLPEPATMTLLGMALVGLGGRALRRRSK